MPSPAVDDEAVPVATGVGNSSVWRSLGRYPPVVVQAGTALVARDAELAELTTSWETVSYTHLTLPTKA